MKVVVAGKFTEYLEWRRTEHPERSVYVWSEEMLRGLRFKKEDVVLVGEWWKSPVTLAMVIGRLES